MVAVNSAELSRERVCSGALMVASDELRGAGFKTSAAAALCSSQSGVRRTVYKPKLWSTGDTVQPPPVAYFSIYCCADLNA